MHSSWERVFLEECIANDVPVTKSHSIRIPYVDPAGVERQYVPDFITTDDCQERLMFEVKGLRDESTNAKDAAARQWCQENGYEFVVIGNSA